MRACGFWPFTGPNGLWILNLISQTGIYFRAAHYDMGDVCWTERIMGWMREGCPLPAEIFFGFVYRNGAISAIS